jgi:hypothetical protein
MSTDDFSKNAYSGGKDEIYSDASWNRGKMILWCHDRDGLQVEDWSVRGRSKIRGTKVAEGSN